LPRTREFLWLPASMTPILQALTVSQLLDAYTERHLAHTATADNNAYQVTTRRFN
jgi:hypothetical protein